MHDSVVVLDAQVQKNTRRLIEEFIPVHEEDVAALAVAWIAKWLSRGTQIAENAL